MTHDHAPRPSPRRQEETEAPTLTAMNAVAEGGMSRCGIGLSQAEAAGGLAQLVTLMARQAARREFRRHRGRSLLGIATILTLLTAALIGATLLYHHLTRHTDGHDTRGTRPGPTIAWGGTGTGGTPLRFLRPLQF